MMPFAMETRKVVAGKLKEFEGYSECLYLDTKGKVTIAVGYYLPHESDLQFVPMIEKKGDLSTIRSGQDLKNEYKRVKGLLKGQPLSYYEKTAKMWIRPDFAERKLQEHIDEYYSYLKKDYSKKNGYPVEFDDMPAEQQKVLFDMIFNLGRRGLKEKFPSFAKALKKDPPDFKEAAIQSYRPDVQNSRNMYVEGLLKSLIPSIPSGASKALESAPAPIIIPPLM